MRKGSFFSADKAPSPNAGKAPSLVLKSSLFFVNAARLNAGKAPYPFL